MSDLPIHDKPYPPSVTMSQIGSELSNELLVTSSAQSYDVFISPLGNYPIVVRGNELVYVINQCSNRDRLSRYTLVFHLMD